MSAIWGVVDLEKNGIEIDLMDRMANSYNKCKIDKHSYINYSNFIMGCEHQFITQESKYDILPFIDKERGLFVTSDIILDNRDELLNLLEIDDITITDGQLLYKSYLKWGEEFPKYLLGDFSFVIYDEKNNEVLCGRDAIGKRSIYYSYEGGIIYFSTLIKSIISGRNKTPDINKRWLNDFLAIDGLGHTTECTETIYNNIFQIEPGQTVKIDKKGISKKYYWNPIKEVKKLKLKSDNEYRKAFIDVFDKCVSSAVRTDGNVGLMLSGGLDSNAIAVFAAKKLHNKTLRTYTSVPLEDYKNDRDSYYIVDESSSVNKLKQYIDNIEPTFLDCKDTDSYSDIESYIDIFEGPYKVIQNTFWINRILKQSSEDSCKVMLNGQYGNATISYGDINFYLKYLISKGRVIEFKKEVDVFCNKNKLSKKRVIKYVLKNSIPYHIQLLINRKNDMFENCLVNSNLVVEMKTKDRFQRRKKRFRKSEFLICCNDALSQLGEIETKFSLMNGVVIRDPSRDKRMIEFCLSLPYNQFVYNGVSRRLMREYLKGYVPDFILDCENKRGLQSADWVYRLNNRWNEIYEEIKTNVQDQNIINYINQDKIKEALEVLKDGINESNENLASSMISVSILSNFMNKLI